MSESVGIRPLTFADLGGGTGYYSASILDALPAWDGVLLDVSKHAAKLAARAHRRLKVATADLRTTIPLITASMDAALVVFAPRNAAEIRRILAPGGVCVVVTPTERHLQELRATQHMLDIDPDKEDRLTRQFADFNLMEQRQIEWQTDLTQQQVQWVVGMGPSAFHTESTDRASHIQDPVNTTVSVTVRAFQPK
jgi:23S rRNA (guanine745-N1)-methyltransferase